MRRLYEEGANEGDLDAVDELVSPDVVTHDPIILDAPTGSDSIRVTTRTSNSPRR